MSWRGQSFQHALAARGIKTSHRNLLRKINNKTATEMDIEAYKMVRELYVDLAYDVTKNYEQEWGDCIKVNGTVVHWLREHGFNVGAIAIMAEFAEEFDEPELGWTDRAAHLVVWFADTDNDDYLEWDDWYDFSTVTPSQIVDYEIFDSRPGYEIDERLFELLQKEYKKNKNYINEQASIVKKPQYKLVESYFMHGAETKYMFYTLNDLKEYVINNPTSSFSRYHATAWDDKIKGYEKGISLETFEVER